MQKTASPEVYELFRSTAREFVLKEVMPLASRIDKEDEFPVDIFKKMGKLGFLGVTIPEEYGGSGMDYKAQAIIEEELGYASASLALSYGAHSNLCLDNLYRNGSEYIRENYVPKLASGEWIGSLCLTEPGSGSDALAMKTSATTVGDKFVITGSKTLITNAPYSDIFLTYAKTGENHTAFAVLGNDSGVSRGVKFDKMGMRGSPTGEVFFDSVEIPKNRIVGEYGKGKDIILSGLNSERVILSFIFIGLARRALELSLKYATERKQSGKFLYQFEMIQEKLAYMYTKYETSKLLANKALTDLETDPMNSLSAAATIMHVAESAEYIAREAIQIYGGIGYVRNSEVERLLRDAILGQIGAGTTEIRKHLISSALVKNYKLDNRIPE
ncbi:MAG: acyl-CoA dehydrogenase family protein [Candidatus Thermoplasmatota archaeon]|nr:acyl-CoA dehydrogenase family protein [Candidatus Thermoplasmatota archaeon]MCL6091250.1 acyl-CoA dehydrogenase family protein [Candidatus Thermoplasmatota archaeon]MDA8142999.1 acyl-CoA dehydrogenase family protein [Thermoplasmatales archaeon]